MFLPNLIAHRGASAVAPENTLAAFKKAKLLGASMVEFDVMLTADNIPVVIHDENIKRTTNGRGLVNSFSFEELKQLDAGRWFSRKFQGETIPCLKEVLEMLDAYDLKANVEIKPIKGAESDTVMMVMSYINQYWPDENDALLISSFNYEVLERVRSFSPEQPIGFLMDKWDDNWRKKITKLNCVSINLNHRCITQARIDELKTEDIKILSYTVNKEKKAKKLLSMGVDAVFSDYADLLPSFNSKSSLDAINA